MLKQILKDTSIYSIAKVLPQISSFLLIPVYTTYLSVEDYGIVGAMQVLSVFFLLVLTFSLDRSIFRLFFDYNDKKKQREFLGTLSIGITTISTIVLIFIFLIKNYIELIYSNIDFHPYYSYTILYTYFMVFSLIPKAYFQVTQQPSKFVSLSLIEFFLTTALILFFVVYKNEGAVGYLKSPAISYFVLLPVYFYITYQIIDIKFNFQIFKDSFIFSLPMIPGFFAAWLLNQSDRVFIERFSDISDVGLYTLAYKFSGISLILSGAFVAAYSPIFFKLANSKKQEDSIIALTASNNIYFISIILLFFLLILFSEELIYFMTDKKYYESHTLIPILALGFLVSQMQGLHNLMIYQEKKVKEMVTIGVIGGVCNIPLNFIFIPEYGSMGAAYATLISFLFMYLIALFYSKKCYYIKPDWKIIFSLFFTCILFFYIISYITSDFNMINSLIFKSIFTLIIFIAFIYLFSSKILKTFRY